MERFVLAIDQGTTSSRALLFDGNWRLAGVSQQEFNQYFPRSGWVEHDPEEIWQSVLSTARAAVTKAGGYRNIVAVGISNQRETSVIWERDSGRPIHNAIVWQDRRTADACEALRAAGHERVVVEKTGLLLDPYFSATKIAWILDHVPGARERAERGELAFGTIDCFLLWRLTGGRVHATDITNAARTCLFDIKAGRWDDELLRIFAVPRALLPEVRDNAAEFGMTDASLFGAPVAVRGMAGDQQAATIGQACFSPGMLKSTYGTGCFAVLNTGEDCIASRHRLLTTIAYQLAGQAHLCAGGLDLHRRRRGAVAARWLEDRRARLRCRGHGAPGRQRAGCRARAGVRRARRAVLGL